MDRTISHDAFTKVLGEKSITITVDVYCMQRSDQSTWGRAVITVIDGEPCTIVF
jgi:hypothetical protein